MVSSSSEKELPFSQDQVHPYPLRVPRSSALGHICDGADRAAGINEVLKQQCFMFLINHLKHQIYKCSVISEQKC